jgi:hypothetical protein
MPRLQCDPRTPSRSREPDPVLGGEQIKGSVLRALQRDQRTARQKPSGCVVWGVTQSQDGANDANGWNPERLPEIWVAAMLPPKLKASLSHRFGMDSRSVHQSGFAGDAVWAVTPLLQLAFRLSRARRPKGDAGCDGSCDAGCVVSCDCIPPGGRRPAGSCSGSGSGSGSRRRCSPVAVERSREMRDSQFNIGLFT